MSNPIPIKQRKEIEALTGIKSSLNHLRSIVALMYLFYRISGYSSRIRYCKQTSDNKLTIEDNLLAKIETFLGVNDLKQTILHNPLFITQYEPLYVGITLLYRLGKITMPGRSATIERTGGNRYPKEIFFAENMVSLDLILQGFSDDVLKKSLISWLNNEKSENHDFEKRVTSFLSLTTIYTQFKIRPENDKELYFQTEGLYSAINTGITDLRISDIHEYVGPTRIFNNVLKEDLDPWIKVNNDGALEFTDSINPTASAISDIITTTLDISSVRMDSNGKENTSYDEDDSNENKTAQTIYYGCPGTGKSYEVKSIAEGVVDNDGHKDGWKTIWFERTAPYTKVQGYIDDKRKKELTNNIFRTTFHPDYDYATFVGCYKPVKSEEDKLDYQFVPQVFTNAYVTALRHPDDPIYLIIEEINRGNCAQIFGDLFQLLDRNDQGVSDYPIKPDTELAKYLKSQDVPYEELRLPANLHIYATMNTSDQSLFPMDSAFKRRWAMEYMPINYDNDKASGFTFTIDNTDHSWVEFLRKVNEMILNATDSEDKQMGEFFIKSSVSEKEFINKVMFYIWNDVCKDLYSSRRISPLYFMRIAEPKDGEHDYFTFADLYGPRNDNSRLLKGFLAYLDKKYSEKHTDAPSSSAQQDDSVTPESN